MAFASGDRQDHLTSGTSAAPQPAIVRVYDCVNVADVLGSHDVDNSYNSTVVVPVFNFSYTFNSYVLMPGFNSNAMS